jgi:hypothetical protein
MLGKRNNTRGVAFALYSVDALDFNHFTTSTFPNARRAVFYLVWHLGAFNFVLRFSQGHSIGRPVSGFALLKRESVGPVVVLLY